MAATAYTARSMSDPCAPAIRTQLRLALLPALLSLSLASLPVLAQSTVIQNENVRMDYAQVLRVEPVFQVLKDENPELITVSRGYREPVCFNTDFNVSKSR